FEYGKACEALYHFAWDDVCDWYLELAKSALDGPDGDTTRQVLGWVLDRLLRLLHPVVPFVTEELWTALTGGETVVTAPWPEQAAALRDLAAEAEVSSLMRLVTEVRRFRSDQGLRPGQMVPAALAGIGDTPLAAHEHAIRVLLRLAPPGEGFSATASVQAEGVTVDLDTAGSIDVDAERRRVEKDLAAARQEAQRAQAKLTSESFLTRAPADVVAKTRDRLQAAHEDIARLATRLESLGQERG
ncbi:MAG TPA: class I tRNA ligase family protein, partial [Streptosporangiaceae bacterium]|nr:class I tRNA ligase family protein [Streptosporangiaceae bacterium]